MSTIAIKTDGGLASHPTAKVRTMVLVGRTGNGKSATGNSILGRRAFKSKASSSTVTDLSELQSRVLDDGQILNVIDTPGLFGYDSVGREIVRCINLAKDGIHAVLIVFSVKTRFSEEERETLRSMRALFGNIIFNYMIVVFTGGDELEDNEETLEEYLEACPNPLKEVLDICGNRVVLFDNKTRDKIKRSEQVKKLLSLVDEVVAQNDGKAYTDELFVKLKEGAIEYHDQLIRINSLESVFEKLERKEVIEKAYDEKLKQISQMVEKKLREGMERLEKQLEEERTARRKAEEKAHLTQMKVDAEIAKLRYDVQEAQEEARHSHRWGPLGLLEPIAQRVPFGPCTII